MHFNKIVTLLLICCVAASFQKPPGPGKNTMEKEKRASVEKAKDTASVEKAKETASVEKEKETASVEKAKDTASVEKAKETASVEKAKETASVEKVIQADIEAIETEDMALIKAVEAVLPGPGKKIAEAVVALVQKIEKDVIGEGKKFMGNVGTMNANLVSMFKGLLAALETGKLSLDPASEALQDIMAIVTAVAKDVMAEAGKLQGPARKVVDAGMGAAKASQGLLKKDAGQAMKIGSEVLKADEALAAGIAQEEGQLLTGNFDTAAIVKTEEKFAKSLVGAEKEAAKDAQMDVSAAIKA